MSAASIAPTQTFPTDLIENKFNELAKKILDELKQSTQRSDFVQALDQILKEPPVGRQDLQARKLALRESRKSSHKQQAAAKKLPALGDKQSGQQNVQQSQPKVTTIITETTNTTSLAEAEALKRQCDLLAERQRQQQEQLDNHQQILFDSQYRSLPSEITQAVAGHEQRRAQHKAHQQQQAHKAFAAVPVAAAPATTTSISQKSSNGHAHSSQVKKPMGSDINSTLSSGLSKSPSKSKITMAQPKKGHQIASSASSNSINGGNGGNVRQRSAIPQSTILSGIQAAPYPLGKSATTTAATSLATASEQGPSPTSSNGTVHSKPTKQQPQSQPQQQQQQQQPGLVRQASLKINKQTREAQQEFIKRHTAGTTLTASEKLRQRRPTKATLSDQQKPSIATSDDSDLDGDDDDDDEDDVYDYTNLASRRAYLHERFINEQQPMQQQPVQINKSKTLSDTSKAQAAASASQQNRRSSDQPHQQTQAKINPVSQVARQKQRFSQGAPIVRSSTIGGSTSQKPSVISKGPNNSNSSANNSRPTSRNQDHQDQPRSLGGLLTSHDIGHLYKPHMNYSTSLLGNHRLSDDDEIIIIPTAQSPSSLMSASVSPDPRHHCQQMTGYREQHQQPDQSTGNMDELSERFSISRTKSFWEKLANSKKAPGGVDPGNQQQQDKQYFNSSTRSIASSGAGCGAGGGPNLVAVDVKSSQNSLLNDSQGAADDLRQQRGYPAAMKLAFDRMDSTGGSGNSHYSGCSSSSTSGDEQINGFGGSGGKRLASQKQGANSTGASKANHQTINQLIRQDELNRSDRFRQTR